MSRRAYIASVEIEIVVVAESEESARSLAAKAYRDEVVWENDFQLSKLSHIPAPYSDDLQDLVHHDGKGDLTLEAALELPGGYKYVKPEVEKPLFDKPTVPA